MSDPASTAIAVLAALGAAGSFGVAAALQHRQAQLAPKSADLSFRLLARLAGRPLWLAGIALAALAYGLQALALAFGPLSLVAPIVATDLLFALRSRRDAHGRCGRGTGSAACLRPVE